MSLEHVCVQHSFSLQASTFHGASLNLTGNECAILYAKHFWHKVRAAFQCCNGKPGRKNNQVHLGDGLHRRNIERRSAPYETYDM